MGLSSGEYVVKQQLSILKASGDYARITREVQEALEREHQEALRALDAAELDRVRVERERIAAEARQREADAARKAAAARAKVAREEAEPP
jgi:hypothetical protein